MAPQTPSRTSSVWILETPSKRQKTTDSSTFGSGTDLTRTVATPGDTTQDELADSRSKVFGNDELTAALNEAKMTVRDLKELQSDFYECIVSQDSKAAQEASLYSTLLMARKLIQEEDLDPSLLNVLNETVDTPEDIAVDIVQDEQQQKGTSTPKSALKKKGPIKRSSGAMDVDSEEAGPRKSARLRDQKKPDTKARIKSRVTNVKLLPPTLKLSSDVGLEDLEDLRDHFIRKMEKTKIVTDKNFKNATLYLDENSQKVLANFVFGELMSDKALVNVNAILNMYKKESAEGFAAHQAIEARQAAEDLPESLQRLALSLAKSTELQAVNGAYKVFEQFRADVEMYTNYRDVLDALDEDKELKQFFVTRNYKTARGRTWKSVLKDYFCDHVFKIKPEAWDSMLHSIAPIFNLVGYFGEGILLVLRREHRSRLLHLGVGAVHTFAPRIQALLPEFAHGLEILTQKVYDPIVEGRVEDLPDSRLADRSGSFLVNIQACFDPNHEVARPVVPDLSDDDDDSTPTDVESDSEESDSAMDTN